MKQYVFNFETDGTNPSVWDEAIPSERMYEAFSKAQQLSKSYARERATHVNVKFKGVKYSDIA
jgi:hypothetical protein